LNGRSTEITATQNLSKRLNIWLLHFNENNIDENVMLGLLQQNKNVLVVQFNHYVELRNSPNDVNFGTQWNMLNIGQTGGTSGADIDALNAWDYTTGGVTPGGDTIVIAIDDAGFELTHEDIHYWKNLNEIPGNSIDDDSNGYVDDYDGWNAISNNGIIPSDYHGTLVSGIAGARGNNSKGVTGVNWNVQIMPVKGFSGVEATVVVGYTYILEMRALYNETAGAKGAFVVSANSSFGINNGQPSAYPLWCAMYDSMGKYGILNAAATANSTVDVDVVGDMPTACSSDYLITVTNTTKTDNKYSSAAFGLTTIDLGAPGTEITSTYLGNAYTSNNTGTSYASPHLAGAVALLYSLPCLALRDDYLNDPAATALHIKNFILDGVDPITDLAGKTVTGGRLNIYKALLNEVVYYNCNVGIEDADEDIGDVIIYPNPATGKLNVLSKLNELNYNIAILNTLGETVAKYNFSSKFSQIDVTSFLEGIYLITISNSSKVLVQKKILILK
jgi:hypothetical protein